MVKLNASIAIWRRLLLMVLANVAYLEIPLEGLRVIFNGMLNKLIDRFLMRNGTLITLESQHTL